MADKKQNPGNGGKGKAEDEQRYSGSEAEGTKPGSEKKLMEYTPSELVRVLRITPEPGARTPVEVSFAPREPVNDQTRALWEAIRLHTEQLAFGEFNAFVERVLDPGPNPPSEGLAEREAFNRLAGHRQPNLDRFTPPGCPTPFGFGSFIPGADLYGVLKLAAEIFLLLRCGICPAVAGPVIEGPSGQPADQDIFGGGSVTPRALSNTLSTFLGNDRRSWIRGIVTNVFRDRQFTPSPFSPLSIGFGPCLLELIWSYWHEEGMLVQTTNSIGLRFQNVRQGNGTDRLAELALDPLRPLGGFLWGYIQDEPHRLSVARRAYEYDHHYGLSLHGRATRRVRPTDPRSKFLQSFHDLLRQAALFYREGTDNTVTPDPFPLLVALRDLHLILAEGAHNQFRDLPWTARVEMLIEQWILARPEMRDFLRGRLMVPYPEPWMGAVDAMKRLQGWTDVNVIHFHDLARYGERILLSIRHVGWNEIDDPLAAQDWAKFWKKEIQGYIHAYRMATGVNLSDDVVEVSRSGDARYLQPALHLRNRLAEQRRRPSLAAGDAGMGTAPGARPRRLRARRAQEP
jgi:hypothetical protein